ncbi:MAG: (deoxy)nucleoside triphosphate pyrophosphohydrolase [Pseudomonadales bacterium]
MINVVCAIIERDGKILVAKRPSDKSMGGKWELPGGKIEPGEDPQAAIAREIREELGCGLAVLAELAPHEHQYADFAIRLIPLLCRTTDGDPKPLEHEEILWAGREELMRLDWAEADIPVVMAYLDSIPGISEALTVTGGYSDASGR